MTFSTISSITNKLLSDMHVQASSETWVHEWPHSKLKRILLNQKIPFVLILESCLMSNYLEDSFKPQVMLEMI